VSSPIWGSWPDIYYCLTVTVLFCGERSLKRGWVCLLYSYMLLTLASVVFLGSESLGTRSHILLSQILDFPFRRLLRLAGCGRGIRTRLHKGQFLLYSLGTDPQKVNRFRHNPNNTSIVACLFVVPGTCLPRRFLSMNVYSYFIIPGFGAHVTIVSVIIFKLEGVEGGVRRKI
jgi:hypothetical protein